MPTTLQRFAFLSLILVTFIAIGWSMYRDSENEDKPASKVPMNNLKPIRGPAMGQMPGPPRFGVLFTGPKPPKDYLDLLSPFGPTSIKGDAVCVLYFGGDNDINRALRDAVDEIQKKFPELKLTSYELWRD